MLNIRNFILFRILGVLLASIIAFYLFPVTSKLIGIDVGVLDSLTRKGFYDALLKSSSFALVSTLINVTLSIFIAVGLSPIRFNSSKGKFLSFLLIPFLLGDVSLSFIGKLLLSSSPLIHDNAVTKFLTLIILQFWQFGTLYAYLFWLVISQIPAKNWEYAYATKMNVNNQVKDIILPSCLNLATLLFILNYIFTIFESSKIQFIFRSGRGTNTELISQWLNRTYQSDSLLDLSIAQANVFGASILTFFSVIVILFTSSVFFYNSYSSLIKSSIRIPVFSNNLRSKILYKTLMIFIFFPIVIVFLVATWNSKINISHLSFPIIYTGLASIIAFLLSSVLAIFIRLGWKNTFDSVNYKSIIIFIFIFLLQLLPPIILYITGFQWLKLIGIQNNLTINYVWILGHVILTLPLLTSFSLLTYFRVSNKEISYLSNHKISSLKIIKDSFFLRFKVDYLLSFIIVFSLIWNESIINNLLSDFIPSFVTEMKMSISGRGADYSRGLSFLLVSFLVATSALMVWKVVLDKVIKDDIYKV